MERRETVELVCDELRPHVALRRRPAAARQAEQADFIQPADVDLDALTEELLAKAGALAPHDWQLDANGVGRLQADRQRLTQAVMQLAQNAVQHTHEGDRIALGSALQTVTRGCGSPTAVPACPTPTASASSTASRAARGHGARRAPASACRS